MIKIQRFIDGIGGIAAAPGKVYRNLNIIAEDTNKKTKDATYSYYEARTYGFSHFAISGQKPEPQPAAVKQVSSAGSKDQDNTGLLLLLIVALAVVGFAFRKRLKNIAIPKISVPSIRIPKIIMPAVIAGTARFQARSTITIQRTTGQKK